MSGARHPILEVLVRNVPRLDAATGRETWPTRLPRKARAALTSALEEAQRERRFHAAALEILEVAVALRVGLNRPHLAEELDALVDDLIRRRGAAALDPRPLTRELVCGTAPRLRAPMIDSESPADSFKARGRLGGLRA